MRLLLYGPYLYGLTLLVIGFWASRLREKSLYFWGSLLLSQISYLGLVLFLVQNFGTPTYLLDIKGHSVTFSYTGLYVAGLSALLGTLWGLGLYFGQKEAFPGLWIGAVSGIEAIVLVVLWMVF
ncbi:MAG: hypothetical protein KatS3mg026_0825 [Bacteroidia bacterium]|nr:MAG: hypothetical protein KatS3mg026_0825 [Bacteroidia bacterium]